LTIDLQYTAFATLFLISVIAHIFVLLAYFSMDQPQYGRFLFISLDVGDWQ
jgi:hypothetical protein